MEGLKLIEPDIGYEDQLLDYVEEFRARGEIVHGGASIQHKDSIGHWIKSVENNRREETVENKLMPASCFILLREEDNRVLGLVDIRHRLNDFLLKRGGHIGYSIRVSERGRGYGSRILALALDECRKLRIDRVLVTCDRDNIGSAKIIQKNGGILENEVDIQGILQQRYWIDL